jgi:anti-sigma factor RsiW
MKCELCEDKLLEYLYGELGEEDAAVMAKHLEASEACRRAYQGFASVLETVAEADEEAPAAALHTRIMGHAEEARPVRRSLWAWMFRPAVTTAVIGAITAGVYFATSRHKPPSYRNDRIVSEQSLLRKAKEERASAPPRATMEGREKEAEDQAFPERLAASPRTLGKGRAAPEQQTVSEERKARMFAGSAEQEEPALEEDRMDEELVYRSVEDKAASIPSHVQQDVEDKDDSDLRTAPESLALPGTPQSTPEANLVSVKRQLPEPIEEVRGLAEEVRGLAEEGNCSDAEKQVEACASAKPKDPACGGGWLEVARCFSKKGDTDAARRVAKKALAFPSSAKEAQAFLESLPSSAE